MAADNTATQSAIPQIVTMHHASASLEASVKRMLGAEQAKIIYEWSIRRRYYDSVQKGIKYAMVAADGAKRFQVNIERPEMKWSFPVVEGDGVYRVDMSNAWNRYSSLLTEAMGAVEKNVNREFYKSAEDVIAAVDAQMFREGLNGIYRVEYARDGKWFISKAQVRIARTGENLQAFSRNLETANAPWRQLNLVLDGQSMLIQDTWIGEEFAVGLSDYSIMEGTKHERFGTYTIRLVYEGPK